MYTQDYDETTPLQRNASVADGKPYWYVLIQPYVKSWPLMLCPDRSAVKTGTGPNYPTELNGRMLGYGYNDGFISDSGYGLTQQVPDPNDSSKTIRPGRSIAAIQTPADCVAFGDTYDTPGYSVAMDNIFTGPDGPSATKQIRHNQNLNYAFVDGHAKIIKMKAGVYGSFNPVARPASETDALKWCYDPDAISDYASFGASTGDYPVFSTTASCKDAVHDYYTGSWVETP